MKRTLSGDLVRVMILVVVFCLFNISTSNAKTIFKIQGLYPKVSDASKSYIFFAEKVKEYSQGEVEVKMFWPGQIVKLKEAFNATQRGMVEGYSGASHYYPGVFIEANGEQLPYAWENVEEAVDIYLNHGYLDLMREAARRHGVYYVAPFSYATSGMITKFPIRKIEDLKGKKIRCAGMQGDITKILKATPVSLAGTEQYVALQRGTVDGTFYPWYCIETYGFSDVVSHIISPPFLTPSTGSGIILNLKMWDKLSPANKEAINRAGMETMWRSFLYAKIADTRALSFFKKKGIEVIELSPEENERFHKAVMPVYESHAKKSDLCAKQVEILKKYWAGKKNNQ
jgi:TRAP-type transport system periplasmic protein